MTLMYEFCGVEFRAASKFRAGLRTLRVYWRPRRAHVSPVRALVLLLLFTCTLHADKIVLVAGGGEKESDAPARECRLREPFAVAFAPGGEMVIVEMEHGGRVLAMDGNGFLRRIAATGSKGYSADGAPGTAATFNAIHNLAIP